MTYSYCDNCGDLLPLPDADGKQRCLHGCHAKNKRDSFAMYDTPKLPATTLIDDINEVIIETEALRLKPEYHSYKVYAYPPSHHMK